MPPFIPVMGLNRSSSVRIGGQTVKYGKVAYVDLGQLIVPLGLAGTAGEAEGTLTKNTNYNYVVTATDAFGGETPAGVEITVKTENVGTTNEIKLTWTAVSNATGYKVYRAKNESGKEVLIAEVTEAKYTDLGATAKTATPPVSNNTYYNPGKSAVSPKKELKEHTTIGQLEVIGPISATNLDWAPLENSAWGLTLESEKAKVAKAKVLKQRSTGVFQENEVAEASITGIISEAEKEKLVAVVYNSLLNKVEGVAGANETTATLAALLEKVTGPQQLLYVLRTKGTTKTVENVTSSVPNAPVVGRT